MTKSVTNALVGLMVMKGELEIDQPAPIEEWQNDPRSEITIDDLLRMSSGLEWEEKYGGVSTATEMLFKSHNTGYYALQKSLENNPGEKWYYSSGTTNILSYIIKSKMSLKEYLAMPYEELFNKLGMASAVIELDASGTYIGSSFMYATPRDWARFGLLYMNDGVWFGERILPEGWIAHTTRATADANGEYGAQFWLNKNNVRLPDVPDDTLIMSGFQGQFVFIIPSEKLIVVRTGFDPDEHFDFNALVSDIIKAIIKK